MKEKLDTKLEQVEIKQTRTKRPTIPFRDSAIDKLKKTNTTFGNRKLNIYKFDIPKGSSLKGLVLRFSRATNQKAIVLNFWFNITKEYIKIYQNVIGKK